MRASAASLLAAAVAVAAQTPTADFDSLFAPKAQEVIPAGSTYKVQWSPSTKYTGTVTIALIGGKDQDHQVAISTLATDVDNSANEYNWAVAATLGDAAVYGLTVTLNSNTSIFQYSNPFHIKGSGSSSSSSSGGSSSPPSTTTSGTSTSLSTSTSVTVITTSPAPSGNYSVTTGPTKVTTTTTSSKTSSGTGAATNTGGAGTVGVGSFALVGGLAMAVLAF